MSSKIYPADKLVKNVKTVTGIFDVQTLLTSLTNKRVPQYISSIDFTAPR